MRLNTVQLSKINITDAFWKRYTDLVEDVIIPYQWDIMNDNIPGVESSHCLENFKIAAGLKKGQFYGAVFQDTDVAKWLEAVGYSLAEKKNEKLEKLADDAIDVIVQAQQKDGYLDTYFIIKEPEQRWRNLCEGHELYSAGHMIEAAIAYYEGTGKRKLLDSMIRLADLICRTFGPEEGQNHGYPGHQEIELALVRLYRVTQDKKYLKQAKYFLDIRGVGENYFLVERKQKNFKRIFPELEDYDPAYSQSHEPVRKQKTAEGHAVRAVYMYSAMADVAEEYQDKELMEACDTWIPLPPREVDKPFLMPIEDVFSITGRGTVATGRIETGIVKVGDEVQIIGLGADGKKSVVTGVEMFRKLLDQGEAGDNVGLLLRGIDKNEIKRGMVICHPGQVKEHSRFKAEVYILKKEEGGRHTPFHNKYRPQFYLRTMDCTGEITLPEGTDMVMPGDNVTINVELIYPVALNVGLRFAIREGGRTVGAGQITELLD